jgi:pimeloyl-ACP methyl ester carboxylesterase
MIVLVLLLLALLMLAAMAVFSYSFFWYEVANGPYLAELERRTGGKPERWLRRGIGAAILAQAAVYLTFPLGYLRRFREPQPDPECVLPPVLLLHGMYHNPSIWIFYRGRLRAAGFRNLKLWNYPTGRVTFPELEERLKGEIAALSDRFDGRPVILVGHSLGGLLARAVASDPETAARIHAIVALGAPHHGTKTVVLGMGKLVKELIYRGPLIQEIESRTAPPEDLPRLNVYTPIDNSVLPPDAARICEPGWQEFETAPISHVSLPYHPKTTAQVIRFLLDTSREGGAEQGEGYST